MKNLYGSFLKTIFCLTLIFLCNIDSIGQKAKKRKKLPDINEDSLITLSKISVFATPGKGIPLAEVLTLPPFFAEATTEYYYTRLGLTSQLPPRTIDTLSVLSDNLVADYYGFYLEPQPLPSKLKYSDLYKNTLPGLPNLRRDESLWLEKYAKKVEIECKFVFTHNELKNFVPTVHMKIEVFGKNNVLEDKKQLVLNPEEIAYANWQEDYEVSLDLKKGFSKQDLEFGLPGNIVLDIYTQALTRLLPQPTAKSE